MNTTILDRAAEFKSKAYHYAAMHDWEQASYAMESAAKAYEDAGFEQPSYEASECAIIYQMKADNI